VVRVVPLVDKVVLVDKAVLAVMVALVVKAVLAAQVATVDKAVLVAPVAIVDKAAIAVLEAAIADDAKRKSLMMAFSRRSFSSTVVPRW